MEAGAEAGAEAAADGIERLLRRGGVGRPRGHPERLGRRAAADRAPLGGAAARRDRPRGRLPHQRRLHQPARPGRDRPGLGRGGRGAARASRPRAPRQPRRPTTKEDQRCSDPAESPAARRGASPAAASPPMPWVPELFSAPALQRLLDKRRRERLIAVPYFDGLMAGEPDALVESFAGEPELHDPVRGRIRGAAGLRGVRRRDARVARGSATRRSRTSST